MLPILERFLFMLGVSKDKPKVNVDVSRAVQRNEQASENVRRELEKLKQVEIIREIAGKAK